MEILADCDLTAARKGKTIRSGASSPAGPYAHSESQSSSTGRECVTVPGHYAGIWRSF